MQLKRKHFTLLTVCLWGGYVASILHQHGGLHNLWDGLKLNMITHEKQPSQASIRLDSRIPKYVTKVYCARLTQYLALYPVCPQCNALVYEAFPDSCSHCGQILSWNKFDEATFLELP